MPEKIDVNRIAHADHARRDELEVAPLPGLLEDRAEAEAEHQQIQQRLAERRDDLRPRSQVALHFAQPEDVDRSHRLIASTSATICRI